MKNRYIIILCTLLFIIMQSTMVFASADKVLKIPAVAAIAYDCTDRKVIYEKNSESAIPIASTTKIMTALVALNYENLNKKVVITSNATAIRGSTVGYKRGEEISIRELVYGLMLRSGNDAAIALAEGISGSIEQYVLVMNEYALQLGLINTHFDLPHGLDCQNHYSTAYDLAVLTSEAIKNPEFSAIVSTKDADEKLLNFTRSYHNINKALWLIPEATGVKTGYTGGAGKCLVTSIHHKGKDYVIVVLNCSDRWSVTKKIYDNYISIQ